MTDQNPHACGDGGCVLLVPGVPVGMHTNGGCRCMPLKTTPNDRVKFRKGIRWLAEEIERLTTEAAGFGTVGTELGERLRGEVLSNCHGCGHDIPSYAPNMSACGVLVAGDTRPMKWLDSADCDKDGYPPKTATGCPAWKAKTDNNEKG